MTFQQARRLLLSFPGVEEGTLVVKCGDAERDFSAVRQNHQGEAANDSAARP
jgi:hypothetical protein